MRLPTAVRMYFEWIKVRASAALLPTGLAPLSHLLLRFDFSRARRNVFDRRPREFGANFLTHPSKIERGVNGEVTWRF